MTPVAALMAELGRTVQAAVNDGRIGTPRSLRLHVGDAAGSVDVDTLLSLADTLFHCERARLIERGAGNSRAALCVWTGGQVATISTAPSAGPVVLLTVLGNAGALHFQRGGL